MLMLTVFQWDNVFCGWVHTLFSQQAQLSWVQPKMRAETSTIWTNCGR